MCRHPIGLFQLGIKAKQGAAAYHRTFCASEIFHCNVNMVNARFQKVTPPIRRIKPIKEMPAPTARFQLPIAGIGYWWVR